MSDNVLMAASNQWSTRPADQRFTSLDALHAAVLHHRDQSVEARHVDLKTLRVEALTPPDGKSHSLVPVVIGKNGAPATFTHHAFGQFARRLRAPADYLRELPAELVALNLNHGIQRLSDHTQDAMLFAQNGSLRLRACLTDKYTRIWNADITSRLIRLVAAQPEWQPAPPAFDGSRGLYASDQDMFAFLVDNDRRIFEKGPGGGLGRGFFVSNSEVGGASFAITTFFYEYVCGNHRVWGASGVTELRIPHIGKADDKAFGQLQVELTKYADSSAQEDERKVASAQTMKLGNTKDEVLDRIFGLRLPGVGLRVAQSAYALAEQRTDWYGDPRTVWGITGALTEIARDRVNADQRVDLEKASGKILQIAF